MTPEQLTIIAGVILSLLFSYTPQLKTWYDNKDSNVQRLIMLGLLFLSALGVFGLSCTPRYDFVTCDAAGAWDMGEYFIQALIANQAAHRITPKVKAIGG
jgi:hypothetical protein